MVVARRRNCRIGNKLLYMNPEIHRAAKHHAFLQEREFVEYCEAAFIEYMKNHPLPKKKAIEYEFMAVSRVSGKTLVVQEELVAIDTLLTKDKNWKAAKLRLDDLQKKYTFTPDELDFLKKLRERVDAFAALTPTPEAARMSRITARKPKPEPPKCLFCGQGPGAGVYKDSGNVFCDSVCYDSWKALNARPKIIVPDVEELSKEVKS